MSTLTHLGSLFVTTGYEPMMDSERSFRVDKLNWSNYQMWKIKIESLLESKDLANYLKNAPGENEDEVKLDKKTRALIRLSVSDDVLPTIVDCATSKQTWEKLRSSL